MKEKPLLSISLLVSNRMDTIRNCMDSLKPILDAIPSELIVVDTVGEEHSDGSLAVAKEYATKIVHFDWCSDFSAARNAGLCECTGEWFMFLDDDEWFEDVTEFIEFFQSGEYLNYASATVLLRNYTDVEGRNYAETPLLRLVKLEKQTRFVGTVHESLSAVYTPCKNFSAYAHHYGYVYKNEEERRQHAKRNMTLLQKELGKNPANLHYRTQMALELANIDNEGALQFCEETFRIFKKQAKAPNFQWQLAMVFRLYEALGTDTATAREKYEELKKEFGYSEMADLTICFQMVRIHILCGECAGAYPYATRYFECLDFLQKHPKEQQLQTAADFHRYQSKNGYLEMLHYGAYSAWQAGDYAMAWNWYREMPWEDSEFENEEAFDLMLGMANENLNLQVLVDVLKRIMKNTTLMQRASVRKKLSTTLQVLQQR